MISYLTLPASNEQRKMARKFLKLYTTQRLMCMSGGRTALCHFLDKWEEVEDPDDWFCIRLAIWEALRPSPYTEEDDEDGEPDQEIVLEHALCKRPDYRRYRGVIPGYDRFMTQKALRRRWLRRITQGYIDTGRDSQNPGATDEEQFRVLHGLKNLNYATP